MAEIPQKAKQTSRIVFNDDDYMDAYAVLYKMNKYEDMPSYREAIYMYGGDNKESFFNSIWVRKNDKRGLPKLIWRKLYDQFLIKKDEIYSVFKFRTHQVTGDKGTSSPYIGTNDVTAMVIPSTKHIEGINFLANNFNYYFYYYGDNKRDYTWAFWEQLKFPYTYPTYIVHGKNFNVVVLIPNDMYNFKATFYDGYFLNPEKYDEYTSFNYGDRFFPILFTVNGIEYYNAISLYLEKKKNGKLDIDSRSLIIYTCDNGIFIRVQGHTETQNNLTCIAYLPFDYQNIKFGKIRFFDFETSKEIDDRKAMTVKDALFSFDYEIKPNSSGYGNDIRYVIKRLDSKGKLTKKYGLWNIDQYLFDNRIYRGLNYQLNTAINSYNNTSLVILNDKIYCIGTYNEGSSIDYFGCVDYNLNVKKIKVSQSYYNAFIDYDEQSVKYSMTIALMCKPENDSYYYIYCKGFKNHSDDRDGKSILKRIVKTKDFVNYTYTTITNPTIIIPLPDRDYPLRIFLDEYLWEEQKDDTNYYNVKYTGSICYESTGVRAGNYYISDNMIEQNQLFYKNNKPCEFGSFDFGFGIGKMVGSGYDYDQPLQGNYIVHIGDLSLASRSNKNFMYKYNKYKYQRNQYGSMDYNIYLYDQTLLNNINGMEDLPPDNQEQGET